MILIYKHIKLQKYICRFQTLNHRQKKYADSPYFLYFYIKYAFYLCL
jgi:hypothetical protein